MPAEDTGPHKVGRRLCAVQAFWPEAKTLAQAEFISAEHCDHRRVEPPFGRRNPKKKDTPCGVSFFLVDLIGFEPTTPTMRMWCAPNCATGPN